MDYDIIIIGSGPGGYVAAIRASQLGLKTAVVEKKNVGGVCLNMGCIPTKSLMKSAQVFNYVKHAKEYGIQIESAEADFPIVIKRSRMVAERMSKGIEFLFKKNKIDVFEGIGEVSEKNTVSVKYNTGETKTHTAQHIILATGARSKELPHLKQDGKKIIGYKEALTMKELPESMIVVGSGAIGTELAYFYNSMGTQVRLVEFLPYVLPNEDQEVSKQMGRSLKKQKIKVMTKASVESADTSGDKCQVVIKTKKGEETHEADVVLSAVGVVPNTENFGDALNDIVIEKGKVKVDDYYRTNITGVYAIGDIVHGPALAHVASAEGICCVEKIAGLDTEPVDYLNIPGGVFAEPEVASVGYTEEAVKDKGIEYKVGKFPFRASGKAVGAGAPDGFVKLIYDKNDETLLGAHIIGANATELIAEAVSIRRAGAKLHDLVKTIHPHPTMSEAVMEAAADAADEAIHI
ncbi:MAG: dihydrolipoyl dehydrogenase [Bacteroidota bacterium]|nr:dihydrolipoyl dehydrogenase [Bacteroidota bacterium]